MSISSSQAGKVCADKVSELREAVRVRETAVMDLRAMMFRSNFKYSPPEPNFDSNRVMGPVCTLIEWYDPEYLQALEVVAGELLYSVVVDSEETSKLLLKRGNLQRSTTFIPLNQIEGEVIHWEVVNAAKEIAGVSGNVHLALDLITYDRKYERAMKFVFGSTLVCKDLTLAMKLAYHPGLYYRVVTQDGHIINPNDTCSGGIKPKGSELAMALALKTLLQDLKMAAAELTDYTRQPYSGIDAV